MRIIKEDNHYILEFFRNNNTLAVYCSSYYDDIRNTLSYNYREMSKGPHNGIYSEIRTNPYKIFENDSDLTYIISCTAQLVNFFF